MVTEHMYFEHFFRLIDLLVSGSTEIIEKIKYYSHNPGEYLASEYGEYCSYEEEDLDDLPGHPNYLINTYLWDILFGILSVENYIYKIDLRTSHENIKYAVNSLLSRKGLPDIKIEWSQIDSHLPSWDVLNFISAKLDPEELKLACIDDGSDSFILILVNKDDFKKLVDTTGILGLKIKTHFN